MVSVKATMVPPNAAKGKGVKKFRIPKKMDVVLHKMKYNLEMTMEQKTIKKRIILEERKKYITMKKKMRLLTMQLRLQNDELVLEEGEIME